MVIYFFKEEFAVAGVSKFSDDVAKWKGKEFSWDLLY